MCVGRFSYLFYIYCFQILFIRVAFVQPQLQLMACFRVSRRVLCVLNPVWKMIKVHCRCRGSFWDALLHRSHLNRPKTETKAHFTATSSSFGSAFFFNSTWAERNITQLHAHKIFSRYFNAFGGIACAEAKNIFHSHFSLNGCLFCKSEKIVTNMSLCLSTPSTGEKKTTSTATIKYRNLLEKQQDEEEFRSECSHGSRKITRSQMKTVEMKIQKKNKRFVSLSSRAHKNSACRHAHCLVASQTHMCSTNTQLVTVLSVCPVCGQTMLMEICIYRFALGERKRYVRFQIRFSRLGNKEVLNESVFILEKSNGQLIIMVVVVEITQN